MLKKFVLDATIGAPAARVCRPAVRGLLHGEAVGGLWTSDSDEELAPPEAQQETVMIDGNLTSAVKTPIGSLPKPARISLRGKG